MNKLKIGDRVKTEDGIGNVVFIDDNAFKFPNKMGVDVLIDGCSEQYGYSLSDLELITEQAFTIENVTVTYSVADGSKIRLTIESISNFPNRFEIITKGAVFANQAELDAILADFKWRAQV
jgi:hypothetical protein